MEMVEIVFCINNPVDDLAHGLAQDPAHGLSLAKQSAFFYDI